MAITKFPFETTEAKTEVTLPVGRHTLQLVVEDSAGLRSAPATVVIEVKKVVLPTITRPTVTTPTITRPTITRPTVTIPTITEPTLTRPTLTRPTLTIPTLTTPTLTEPTVTIPTLTRPTLTIPTLTELTVTRPTLTRPTLTIPTVTVPTATMMTMTAPTVISTLNLPEPTVITRGKKAAGKTNLTAVKGVTAESAGKLRTAGIADAETLAKAAADKVASALGIESAKARTLISEAKKTVKK